MTKANFERAFSTSCQRNPYTTRRWQVMRVLQHLPSQSCSTQTWSHDQLLGLRSPDMAIKVHFSDIFNDLERFFDMSGMQEAHDRCLAQSRINDHFSDLLEKGS
mmetsp:Transcript_35724/g.86450  ORF Transcript_35724/g.86450 Transcript_35724/m.86450 type:complete len:104 (-) Transcript_35724:1729-2040(-)